MIRISALIAALALAGCSADAPDATGSQSEADAQSSKVEVTAPANSDEDIQHFLLQEYPDAEDIRYALAWHDLDGDGGDEAIVHVVSSWVCGSGGCNTLVLTQAGPMWRKVGDISVSRSPVTVLDSSTEGWKDITVDVSGGGSPSGIALLKFDGETYPSNPTVAPAEAADARGEVLIAEEPELVELPPMEPSEG